jgi:hypothetical protein
MTKHAAIADIRRIWDSGYLYSPIDVAERANSSPYMARRYYPYPDYGMVMFAHKQIAKHIDTCPYQTLGDIIHQLQGVFSAQQVKMTLNRITRLGGPDEARGLIGPLLKGEWSTQKVMDANSTYNPSEHVSVPENKPTYVPREPASLGEQLEILIGPDGQPQIGKPHVSLIPEEVLTALENVLGAGYAKHANSLWDDYPRDWMEHYGAVLRHLMAWHQRGGPDGEFGESHLSHAVARLSFLIASEARGIGKDDRP